MLPCNWLQIKDNSMDPVHTSFLHAISSGYQFTEAFGALAELDWEETPYGMIYIATRRIGDLVWVRVCDFMAPNVHQFTREIEEASREKIASRPVIIRWAVPIDDTHTWNMELAQVDPAWGLTPAEIGRPGFGQSNDRPYEERQAHPADYDAQSGQRADRHPRARAPGLDGPRRPHAAEDRARRHPRRRRRARPEGAPARATAADRHAIRRTRC